MSVLVWTYRARTEEGTVTDIPSDPLDRLPVLPGLAAMDGGITRATSANKSRHANERLRYNRGELRAFSVSKVNVAPACCALGNILDAALD